MMENDIIIIGGGNHHNTLGVIRSLGQRKQTFDLITYGSLKYNYVASSRYVSNHIAFVEPEEIILYLLSRPFKVKKAIIISCADSITEQLSLHYEELANKYIIPGVASQGVMCRLQDKSVMIKMAAELGLLSPQKWLLPEDMENILYPCITKSYLSSHGGKSSVVILRSKDELATFYGNHQEKCFVQEYIIKKEEVQFIGCSLNGGETVIIPGMTKIIRSQPNTNTGFLEYGPIETFWDDIVIKSKQYIKECGYSGLFSIEFLRDYKDQIYFLETNFRNDGNAYCVTAAGVNLPMIWIKSCQGEDFSNEIRKVNNVVVMPEFQDFKLVLQRKISFFLWIKDLCRTNCFLEWDKHDIRPFFQFIINKICSILW